MEVIKLNNTTDIFHDVRLIVEQTRKLHIKQ